MASPVSKLTPSRPPGGAAGVGGMAAVGGMAGPAGPGSPTVALGAPSKILK